MTMARGAAFAVTATSTALVLMILVQSTLVWREMEGAPATGKKSDILAGTEFLSVFINGAMAPTPPRRRGFRRGYHTTSPPVDSQPAESRQHEASIYRISRNPGPRPVIVSRPQANQRTDEVVRFYPVSHRAGESQRGGDGRTTTVNDLGTTRLTLRTEPPPTTMTSSVTSVAASTTNSTSKPPSRQKVIGVSVTSTVEATPYKVRVEHYDTNAAASDHHQQRHQQRRPVATLRVPDRNDLGAEFSTIGTTASSTSVTPSPARAVTEELSNIVSESNRSEFSVDEGSPRTSWSDPVTPAPTPKSAYPRTYKPSTEPVEINYELPEENSEQPEFHRIEPPELSMDHLQLQPRKVGRHYHHYDSGRAKSFQGQTSKSFKQPRNYGETVYGEPEKIYGEPAKVYGEPAKVYGEPEKVYSEPSKVYSEPSKVYSEPAKVYSEPAKVYSEPAKIYDSNGRPVEDNKPSGVYPQTNHEHRHNEPDEENYEVDESVSVGSNGNVHGPQLHVTEPPSGPMASSAEDGHKVSYVVEGRNYRRYRVEERTPDGFIVGEYGVLSHDDGSLRGVRYTADGTINPRLIYDALMKFLAL